MKLFKEIWDFISSPGQFPVCPVCGSDDFVEVDSASHWSGFDYPPYDECYNCGYTKVYE